MSLILLLFLAILSLSARRAWIEISGARSWNSSSGVALRKESVDRNNIRSASFRAYTVALRKESVDRNQSFCIFLSLRLPSLSARRAWIEMPKIDNERKVALRKESVDRNGKHSQGPLHRGVALRKESVDRNTENAVLFLLTAVALRKESVDRNNFLQGLVGRGCVALRKESVDRNIGVGTTRDRRGGRSPQGERG